MRTTFDDFRAVSPRLVDEATVLFRRYPGISGEEERRLLGIYPMLSVIHRALIRSDEELAPRLEAFRKAHAPPVGSPDRDIAARILPFLVLAAALAWAIFN
jgi:hypothetical protein